MAAESCRESSALWALVHNVEQRHRLALAPTRGRFELLMLLSDAIAEVDRLQAEVDRLRGVVRTVATAVEVG